MDILAAGGLHTAFLPMGEADALRILQENYGVSGQLKRLATEKDDTFRVRAGDGAQYILKIANGGEDAATVALQDEILKHIERHDPGLPVPRCFADKTGRTIGIYSDADGTERLVRLLSFIAGTPLDATTSTSAGREKIGVILARLRHATAGFSHPAEDRVLAWDVQHLKDLAPLLDEVKDPGQKALLQAGLDRFMPIAGLIPGLRRQVLHNDFSKSNLIVDPAHADFVTGIIDFGDTVKTAIAIDASTALLNQLPPQPADRMLDAPLDVLRGYLGHADLTPDELRLLPYLILGRIIARALITNMRAQLFPDNATYIMRNTPQGWHQLAWFLDQRFDTLSDKFSGFAP
jgi:Ser/Thr protein kinase RdoA (MazF antagonist)